VLKYEHKTGAVVFKMWTTEDTQEELQKNIALQKENSSFELKPKIKTNDDNKVLIFSIIII
jgi:hypothetical protein